MSETEKAPGTIGWIDCAVEDATALKDFYQNVTGWKSMGLDMGGYEDYCMMPPASDDAVTGICHARGSNETFPKGWTIYIMVADLDQSIAACKAGGGEILVGPKSMGADRFCIMRDPAGQHFAAYQKGEAA